MMTRKEVERVKHRIAVAERRLGRGIDERQEQQRGTVRESEIAEHLREIAALWQDEGGEG